MNRVLKIVLVILAIIVLIAFIFFIVDYSRVKKGETPIFCILKDTALDGGTNVYIGFGYKVIDFNRLGGYDEIKIGSLFMKYEDFENEFKEIEQKPVIIESTGESEEKPKIHIEILDADGNTIDHIIKYAEYKEDTCDGINNYIITSRAGETYGIEVYENSCHVTLNGKEAVLNESDSNYLIGIIDIYMKDAM